MGVLRFPARKSRKPGDGFTPADAGEDDPSNDLATAQYARDQTEAEIFRLQKLIERVRGRVSAGAEAMLLRLLKESVDGLTSLDDEIAFWKEIVAEAGEQKEDDPSSGA